MDKNSKNYSGAVDNNSIRLGLFQALNIRLRVKNSIVFKAFSKGESAFGFATQLQVQAFTRIGGLDQTPNFRAVVEYGC